MKDCAKVGLMPWEADKQYPVDLWLVRESYLETEKEQWERARMIAFNIHLHAMTGKGFRKSKRPQEFWPFPWDAQKGEGGLTAREIADKRHAELRKQRNARRGLDSTVQR